MYLEEVIIDGFKSYAARTIIGPFHSQFNAISGLNGTGKSNILDSICFVMGIKSLQQMRVSKLDELIYKQGQAGVTKASVTLVFRNDDRKLSPVGMADLPKITISRQIAIGGRDRFVMNGHGARPSDIQTVFQSVQLNVNNPHFLVMQGRITKVIHMKPPEILGLIEESAGTRLYEVKRSESAKKIATKETKLTEIESIMRDEIEPALEKLKQEQMNYTTSLRASEEVSRLERYCRAYEYYRVIKDIKNIEEKNETIIKEVQDLESQKIALKNVVIKIEKQLKEVETRGPNPERKKAEALIQEKRKLENELVVQSVLADEKQKEKDRLDNEIKELTDLVETTKQDLTNLSNSSLSDREREKKQEDIVNCLQQQMEDVRASLEELRTGHVSSKKGTSSSLSTGTTRQTLRQKLVGLQLKLTETESEVKQLQLSIQKWKEDIQITKSSSDSEEHINAMTTAKKQVTDLGKRAEMIREKLANDSEKLVEGNTFKKDKDTLDSRLAALEEIIEECRRQTFIVTRFHKENPNAADDGIEGIAAELFTIKEDHLSFMLALEEAGKSRLLNIVVKDDEVAKHTLEKYKSLRRITCIPLNRICANPISDDRLLAAKQAANLPNDSEDVQRPLDTAEPIASKFIPSLTFVFGQTFLCTSSKIAQAISQHPRVKGYAITTAGDQYNPSGSVSGGSQAGFGGLLSNLRRLKNAEKEYNDIKKKLIHVEAHYTMFEKKTREQEQLTRELESIEISLGNSKIRLEELHSRSTENQVAKLQQKVKEAETELYTLQDTTIPRLRDVEIPGLQQELEAITGSRAERIEKLETQLQLLKTKLTPAQIILKKDRECTVDIRREMSILEEQLVTTEKELLNKKTIESKSLLEDYSTVIENKTLTEHAVAAISSTLRTVELQLKEQGQRTTQLTTEKHQADVSLTDIEASLLKAQHTCRCYKQNLQDLGKRRTYLLRDYSWLQGAEPEFNQPGSDFNFNQHDTADCFEKLDILKRDNEQLQKKVNKNVISVLITCEKELHELKEKKAQLIRDKHKLEQFIEELDIKKKETLKACWTQVDMNLSAIFSTLLPSSDAHLSLTTSQTLQDGLEMRVTLSGIEKSSLNELSGGQRSLLSLSLVLALLKYKPAPLYILDEIDAALDLSHTQKIGKMIRSQFSKSQFLVVSLKENLFNYADVLFRTSFHGGSSRVSRTVHTLSETINEDNKRLIKKLK